MDDYGRFVFYVEEISKLLFEVEDLELLDLLYRVLLEAKK